jgi:ketosteroid isomerase-like protein
MEIGYYRITDATLALFQEDGRHVAHTVPVGAVVTVDGNKLIEVVWDGKKVMMFTQDLRTRSLLVD